MHILLISEYWSPVEHGGGERSARDIAVGLAAQGNRITVLTSAGRGLLSEETLHGVRVLRRCTTGAPTTLYGNIKRYLLFKRSALREARRLCGSDRIDVIHLMNTTTLPLAPALRQLGPIVTAHINSPIPFCPKGDRVRYGRQCDIVCTWNAFVPCIRASQSVGKMRNGALVRHNPLLWLSLYRRYRAYRHALAAPVHWAAIGSGLAALLEQHGVPSSRVTLLPNPVSTAALESISLPTGHRPLRVGFIGTFSDFKGLPQLVDACRGLKVELHVAGEGPLATWLDGIKDVTVVNHGRVAESSLASFYAKVDIVAIPSIWPEGFGRVVVEAMAAGRPVIVTDNGGLRDVVAGCTGATLVPVGDVAALHSALERYARSPSRCRVDGAACRQHVARTYTQPLLARKLASMLRQAAAS